MYSWPWLCLRDYFDVEADISSIDLNKLKAKRHCFFEFPHGVFPMGQFLSASMIKELFGDEEMICGTGADIIFKFPILRHVFSMLGTRPVSRQNFKRIIDAGHHAAVVPGGIAEMYKISNEKETIYFKSRKSTVKLAIQLGTDIIPIYFFGNTRLFTVVGQSNGER